MTREEYLRELKACIQALPLEEQNEALDYYYNYFEDAGDDEKVIKELGNPEKLADAIKEKFACVPAARKEEHKTDSDEQDSEKVYTGSNVLKYFYPESAVKNLDFNLGLAEIVMISGKDYTIETRGFTEESLLCSLSAKGTLILQNRHRLPSFNFTGHENNSVNHPRILITIPENPSLEAVRMKIGAGSFLSKGTKFSCKRGSFEAGAGSLTIGNVTGGEIDFRCGMGSLNFTGVTHRTSNIDCGMGQITLEISGNEEDYSMDAKVGLGSFRMNRQKKSGIGDIICTEKKENHFSVNCGFGSVTINIR